MLRKELRKKCCKHALKKKLVTNARRSVVKRKTQINLLHHFFSITMIQNLHAFVFIHTSTPVLVVDHELNQIVQAFGLVSWRKKSLVFFKKNTNDPKKEIQVIFFLRKRQDKSDLSCHGDNGCRFEQSFPSRWLHQSPHPPPR